VLAVLVDQVAPLRPDKAHPVLAGVMQYSLIVQLL
jgi:hypothetical protein